MRLSALPVGDCFTRCKDLPRDDKILLVVSAVVPVALGAVLSVGFFYSGWTSSAKQFSIFVKTPDFGLGVALVTISTLGSVTSFVVIYRSNASFKEPTSVLKTKRLKEDTLESLRSLDVSPSSMQLTKKPRGDLSRGLRGALSSLRSTFTTSSQGCLYPEDKCEGRLLDIDPSVRKKGLDNPSGTLCWLNASIQLLSETKVLDHLFEKDHPVAKKMRQILNTQRTSEKNSDGSEYKVDHQQIISLCKLINREIGHLRDSKELLDNAFESSIFLDSFCPFASMDIAWQELLRKISVGEKKRSGVEKSLERTFEEKDIGSLKITKEVLEDSQALGDLLSSNEIEVPKEGSEKRKNRIASLTQHLLEKRSPTPSEKRSPTPSEEDRCLELIKKVLNGTDFDDEDKQAMQQRYNLGVLGIDPKESTDISADFRKKVLEQFKIITLSEKLSNPNSEGLATWKSIILKYLARKDGEPLELDFLEEGMVHGHPLYEQSGFNKEGLKEMLGLAGDPNIEKLARWILQSPEAVEQMVTAGEELRPEEYGDSACLIRKLEVLLSEDLPMKNSVNMAQLVKGSPNRREGETYSLKKEGLGDLLQNSVEPNQETFVIFIDSSSRSYFIEETVTVHGVNYFLEAATHRIGRNHWVTYARKDSTSQFREYNDSTTSSSKDAEKLCLTLNSATHKRGGTIETTYRPDGDRGDSFVFRRISPQQA